MKNLGGLILFVFALIIAGCKDKTKADLKTKIEEIGETISMEETTPEKSIVVVMHAASNSNVEGEVIFTQKDNKVKMQGLFSGLNPGGKHAIHLHEKADCSAPDATSAGGHWNPTNQKHGKWEDADGFHQGDIGNLEVSKDGQASITFETDRWCIDCEEETMNIIGKGIIVHEDKDDFVSQPTGDAGERISCGEIKL